MKFSSCVVFGVLVNFRGRAKHVLSNMAAIFQGAAIFAKTIAFHNDIYLLILNPQGIESLI